MTSKQFDSLMAWGRYLCWCDLNRQRFEAWLGESPGVDDPADGWRFVALVSQWYASLWVVVEGWKILAFEDATIDGLLEASDHCDRLRRYRNCIYHYQPRLLEPRFVEFLAEADGTVPWVEALHYEFLRFFDEALSSISGEANRSALRETVFRILGWLPTDEAIAKYAEAEKLCSEAENVIARSDHPASSDAMALRVAVGEARSMLTEGVSKYLDWRRGQAGGLIEELRAR